MKKRKSIFKRLTLKILSKINTTGGTFIVIASIFGFGFAAGTYLSNISHQIEMNNINQKQNKELVLQKKEFEESIDELKNIINELKHKNNMLEYNLNKLNHENK